MTNCNHCGMDIAIRNPSGYCDHLYYPDNCEVCKMPQPQNSVEGEVSEILNRAIDDCEIAYGSDIDQRTYEIRTEGYKAKALSAIMGLMNERYSEGVDAGIDARRSIEAGMITKQEAYEIALHAEYKDILDFPRGLRKAFGISGIEKGE